MLRAFLLSWYRRSFAARYIPINGAAISDLFDLFRFGDRKSHDERQGMAFFASRTRWRCERPGYGALGTRRTAGSQLSAFVDTPAATKGR